MTAASYEIRLCQNCGLRYPLTESHPFGERCPVCLGTTQAVLKRSIPLLSSARNAEPGLRGEIQLFALLDNIRSAWNVGAIFRTADGLGINKLYLCGITPTPEIEAVRKTALGAEGTVVWEYSRNALEAAQTLKEEGCSLVALEQDNRAIALSEYQTPISETQSQILIVGNEITGVDPELLDLCDQVLYIPMLGRKRSLNVEVAFGIAAFQLAINLPQDQS